MAGPATRSRRTRAAPATWPNPTATTPQRRLDNESHQRPAAARPGKDQPLPSTTAFSKTLRRPPPGATRPREHREWAVLREQEHRQGAAAHDHMPPNPDSPRPIGPLNAEQDQTRRHLRCRLTAMLRDVPASGRTGGGVVTTARRGVIAVLITVGVVSAGTIAIGALLPARGAARRHPRRYPGGAHQRQGRRRALGPMRSSPWLAPFSCTPPFQPAVPEVRHSRLLGQAVELGGGDLAHSRLAWSRCRSPTPAGSPHCTTTSGRWRRGTGRASAADPTAFPRYEASGRGTNRG